MARTKNRRQAAPLPQTSRGFSGTLGLTMLTALLTAAAALYEPLWPLTWVALAPLFVALRALSPKRAFLWAWWTESVTYWLGFYWMIGTMVDFGYIPLPLSILFFGIIGIGNGIRWGLFAWWLRLVDMSAGPWWARLLFPACLYVTLDVFFPRVFPWYLGFLQFPAPLVIQIADITGVHGVTFLLVLCSTVCAACVPWRSPQLGRERLLMGLTLGVLLVLQIGYGLWRMPQVQAAMQRAPSMRLALLQTNIGMHEKRQGMKKSERLDMQLEMSLETLPQRPDLIIWPESMYPYPVPLPRQKLPLPRLPTSQDTHWLVGALAYTRDSTERQVFNSAFLVAPDARILGRYDKQQLLAFGEYIPMQQYFPFLRRISPAIGNLTPGTGSVVTLPNGVNIGPLICYEDILPALARKAVQQGAHVLVNMTNDVWFGPTRAPYQHRALGAFRAVENRVYLVRVTNTGLTSIIDALGRERGVLPLYQRKAVVQEIQPLQIPTFYTRFGDWFAWLCCAVMLVLSARSWINKRRMVG